MPHILWITHPTDSQRDPGISGWTFWQHSFAGKVAGISGNVDLDYFAGTETALDRILIRLDPATGRCAPASVQN